MSVKWIAVGSLTQLPQAPLPGQSTMYAHARPASSSISMSPSVLSTVRRLPAAQASTSIWKHAHARNQVMFGRSHPPTDVL